MKNFAWLLIFVIAFTACSNEQKNQPKNEANAISGNLTIFHAGSLSVPMKEIAAAFEKENPNVKVLLEAAGSKACARKISDLKRECDIMASADYKVIENMLMPEWADWCIKFATNEMTIVYSEKSKYANQINKDNWYEILMKKDVAFGRSDPNADPCGVRAAFMMQLAEKFYNKKGLFNSMIVKDEKYIRPKETDLLTLLESGSIDYIFIYKSVAAQHNLKSLILPDEVNLKNADLASYYETVSYETNGTKPGEKITEKAEPIVYGITIPKNAVNTTAAIAFMDFFLNREKGLKIIEQNAQISIITPATSNYEKVPALIQKYLKAK